MAKLSRIELSELRKESEYLLKTLVPFEVKNQKTEIARTLIKTLKAKTPVDTGFTKASWRVSTRPPSGPPSGRGKTGLRYADQSELDLLTIDAPPGVNLHVYNTSIAAEIIEFGLFQPSDPGPSQNPDPRKFGRLLVSGGFSTFAPQGIIRISVEEVNALFP